MKPGKMCCKSCGMSWPRQHTLTSIHEQQAIESTPCPVCGAMTLSFERASTEKISGLSLAALMGCLRLQPAR
ncbi:hypothetical protein KIH39_03940 [Telmatocola sphagniphila]|uniref:Uncharacterized protein n=1 Tax=Telmatocola sphagniphila TaxID=1123043 RepID=A0A8E6B827_9BACT|nr:hypothetical protein [Telmatocola sphagniphila]QVL33077.1 hypothetical protein KIH39_03940 [Telmatocola sphagniphila]